MGHIDPPVFSNVTKPSPGRVNDILSLGMLGGYLFVNMSGDFNDGDYFDQKIEELVEQLERLRITPSTGGFLSIIY